MKKILLLVLVITSLVIAGCSSKNKTVSAMELYKTSPAGAACLSCGGLCI